jgi:hypothetical protein
LPSIFVSFVVPLQQRPTNIVIWENEQWIA